MYIVWCTQWFEIFFYSSPQTLCEFVPEAFSKLYQVQIIHYSVQCSVLEADMHLFKEKKYKSLFEALLLTSALPHMLHQNAVSEAKNKLMSVLNMHERDNSCSRCIGVVDFLHRHYHKLIFIARLAWWSAALLPKAVAHHFPSSIIRVSPSRSNNIWDVPMLCAASVRLSYLKSGGAKQLSIFISGLDLFWAVIKVHLPLRISIMMSLTRLYMEAHGLAKLTCTSLIKSVELWIYSKACMINEDKDLVQYCRLFHNFTTYSFPLTWAWWGKLALHRMASRRCQDTAAASACPAEVLRERRRRQFPVSIIVLLSGSGGACGPLTYHHLPPSL